MMDGTDALAILIVEDEPATRMMLAGYFREAGFVVMEAGDAATARNILRRQPPHLVILDLHLPDEDGLMIAREIRSTSNIGIIIVTARDGEDSRLAGLEIGSDHYIVKPVNGRELLARARNLLRRTHPIRMSVADGERHFFLGWCMDFTKRHLADPQGRQVALTRGEFDLLGQLVRAGGRVISRAQLSSTVSGPDRSPTDRTIDVLVSRLRRKLGDDGANLIVTDKGFGYRLGAEVTLAADQAGSGNPESAFSASSNSF